jgi:beta-glucosidase
LNDPEQRAKDLVAKMTEDEKLRFIRSDAWLITTIKGGGAGHIPGLSSLRIPEITMADSATGVTSKYPSTVFPSNLALAASWNTALAEDYGAEIAKQTRAQGFAMNLGGGANMVRDPRGGRIFEYLGEDPLLAGKLLAARTRGTSSQKVMTTIKHLVGNEQESWRGTSPSIIRERTLREIYLRPFEIAIEESPVSSVMCSYNRLSLDGYAPKIYACEHPHTLTDILKKEWGFKGQVQSDWMATHSTANAINAGLDEEEWIFSTFLNRAWFDNGHMKWALHRAKTIKPERLDDMVKRKLWAMITSGVMDNPPPDNAAAGFKPKTDLEAGAAVARRTAQEAIVLLKNRKTRLDMGVKLETKLLPLDASKIRNIAVIGAQADKAVLVGMGSGNVRTPRLGGYGCGNLHYTWTTHVIGCLFGKPWKNVETPIYTAIKNMAGSKATVTFGGHKDRNNPFRPYREQEIKDAVSLAGAADVAIVVAHQAAGEDGDLNSLSLENDKADWGFWNIQRNNQDELIRRVAAANRNTIVILENGNPVLMPWIDKVAAVLVAWYPGEEGGKAIADILFGKVNPSGKLPLTFPKREVDTPTNGAAFTESADYTEELKVGYRWYDAQGVEPEFAFGFGLSYTEFSYSDLRVDTAGDNTKTVTFSLKNIGKVAGKEVPQVYIEFPKRAKEPPKTLVGWDKVELQPGETKLISIKISPRMQSIWDTGAREWKFVGASKIMVGASSRKSELEL